MQQVNLYSEILKHQKQSGIKLTTLVLAAMIGSSTSFSAYLLWNIGATETELHQAQLTLDQQQVRVNELLSKRPGLQLNEQLIGEIEQWQNNILQAEQTLHLLGGRESILSQGFSVYLQGLANQFSSDVWLTAIHIDNRNRNLRLEGSTFKPEQIAQTLQKLQQEPVFKGQTFAKLLLQPSTKIIGQMDYTLSSSEQPLTITDHAQ